MSGKFDTLLEGQHIAKAISKVLEQQQIEWVNKGVPLSSTYVACLAGLSSAVYDEIANFGAIQLFQNKEFDIEAFKEYYYNNICLEAEEARQTIIKLGKEVLKNGATWNV